MVHDWDASTDLRRRPRVDEPAPYRIRVFGRISPRWADWFAGLEIRNEDQAIGQLRGTLLDQATLLGVLQKLVNLGLPLLEVVRLETPQSPPAGEENP